MKFPDSAVTRQPAGVAHEPSEPRMVGMLVFHEAWREHNAGPQASNDACQLDRMSGANFKVRVTIQFDKFKRSAQEPGRPICLEHPLSRCAVGPGFAARTDDKVSGATSAGFLRNDAPATEFDIIGMRGKSQQRQVFRTGFRCRLHRGVQSFHDPQT